MAFRLYPAIVLAISLLFLAQPALAAKRVALVIGISKYVATKPLKNPVNDAALVARSLEQADFQTVTATDLTTEAFKDKLHEFHDMAQGADIAIVYYAGHGIGAKGTNWLIPSSAELHSAYDLDNEAIPLDRVVESTHGARLRMVILDACRNSPFGRNWASETRAVTVGLADQHYDDILILYSAEPGSEATDGTGSDTPFASALAEHILDADLPIQLLGGKVRDGVLGATNGAQRPYFSGSVTGDPIYLIPGQHSAQTRNPEDEAWSLCKIALTALPCNGYLKRYPKGRFADLAQLRRSELANAGRRPLTPQRTAEMMPMGPAPDPVPRPQPVVEAQPAGTPASAYVAPAAAFAQSAGRGTGLTAITIGALDSALDCKLYAVTSGASAAYADASRIAVSRVWKTSLYRDCVNHFAGVREALAAALGSSGTISVGSGGYTLSARISETSQTSNNTGVAGMSDGSSGFGVASAGLGLEVSVTVRDRAGKVVFGSPVRQRVETAGAVDTGSAFAGSSQSGEGIYSTLQRQVAIAVARRVAFHFTPLSVLAVKDRKVQLNFGAPLLQSGDIVNVTGSDGFTAIRYRVSTTSPDRAIAEKFSDGDESQIRAGNIATFVDEDSGMDNLNRFDRVELP